ncbi:hypothetical protein IPZ58_07840 [Streptomyces roseoverticillatus]|uniref:hypothetical protein n=1 Tax=Streptomyces roseoverticillatus TaxID=66429 RepID=UPI001F374FC5|nr:hypothetical protein [Streptomyces roseoverticillatus]MCF3101490.1 hypothetical protein [Streptomyces roseoverticillatus]
MSGEARVRKARDVIVAAWEVSRNPLADTASEAAQALEAAGLLQSPETAAELERLRQLELEVCVEISRLTSLVSPPATTELTVYEARYDGVPLRQYTSLGAAQEHCETHARRVHSRMRFEWAGPELLMRDDSGAFVATGHTVEAVQVASAYDAKGAR